ncbi:hypothetical protein E4U54_005255 [Claviceps lovelessii]|nr:hypothetical protein E4U54_005255 [Claviceps lovelessii]
MPQSLRSILGMPRISKASSRGRTSISSSNSRHDAPQRPQRHPQRQSCSRGRKGTTRDHDDLLFPDTFPDLGDASVLLDEHEALAPTLRDVVQAMRYIRGHMFRTVRPGEGRGFTSWRRASVPGMVTMGHIHAVLRGTRPSCVEREVAELVGKGVLRRIRVERRGGLGEAVVEMDHVRAMLGEGERKGLVRRRTGVAFWRFLRRRPAAMVVRAEDMRGDEAVEEEEEDDDDDAKEKGYDMEEGYNDDNNHLLTHGQVDELIKAGFLTNCAAATAPANPLLVRPEDRTTLTSIAHVSRFASGTVSAVGGRNALHLAGGGGGGGGGRSGSGSGAVMSGKATATRQQHRRREAPTFRIALPGHGRYLKLADAAVQWLTDALGRTRWGEGPEAWLRERFEARGAGAGAGHSGPRCKDLGVLEWEWVLGQAVGLGVVEVFETGSVGKGVRLLT